MLDLDAHRPDDGCRERHPRVAGTARLRVGQHVEPGAVIGNAPDGLGVAVHASIGGTVASVGEQIVIRRSE